MKDKIHGVIVSLYYLVLKAMKKYPNPEEVASAASQQANDICERGVSSRRNLSEGKRNCW